MLSYHTAARGSEPRPAVAKSMEISWPRSAWTADGYFAALRTLAQNHAGRWGRAQQPAHWQPLPGIYDPSSVVAEARAAVERLEASGLYRTMLSTERIHLLLAVLDNPHSLLGIITPLPPTLLLAEEWLPRNGDDLYPRSLPSVGPAPYDLACFYSTSRWWFGRTPLSTVDTRNAYLGHLNPALAAPLDRYLFDMAFDAALAWRFAVMWTRALESNPISFLARSHLTRAALVDPAFASLGRVLRS